MNPDKMRSNYGKMLYVLMDAQKPSVKRESKGFNIYKKVKTVYRVLKQAAALEMLEDPLLQAATRPIKQNGSTSVREQSRVRDTALKNLISKYCAPDRARKGSQSEKRRMSLDMQDSETSDTETESETESGAESETVETEITTSTNSGTESEQKKDAPTSNTPSKAKVAKPTLSLTPELVKCIVDSILDNFSFLESNLLPVIKLINYLKATFNPNQVPSSSVDSLEIRAGKNGSELSHGHTTQFNFVLQSLTLWRNILRHFFQAWMMAEKDLLAPHNGYRLMNTGQGLQRCQGAPSVSSFMHRLLAKTKQEIKQISSTYEVIESKVSYRYQREWVGLSVVHLGDRDVPNALVFIDKYTQISRMLAPLVQVLERIDIEFDKNAELRNYVNTEFGGKDSLRKIVLGDYFRHGFDGSGDDGGSCIDGRLTSSWNWCARLEKKRYYPVFLLAGFLGFDGDFRE